MSAAKSEKKPANVADEELDDLLDKALMEMAAERKKKDSIGGSSIHGDGTEGVDWNPSENVWSDEFFNRAASTFESNMASLLSSMKGVPEDSVSQEQIAATFKMMAEAAAQVMKPLGQQDTEEAHGFAGVNAAVAHALENMHVNTSNLKKHMTDSDLQNMFAGLNIQKEGAEGNVFLPFMQDMMRSLLSKDVLYPSIKEIVDKYPQWLSKNKNSVSAADFDRYTKQSKLMVDVCTELESEKERDSEDTKKKRFEKVLVLMQKMQELGEPPSELQQVMPGTNPSQCKPM